MRTLILTLMFTLQASYPPGYPGGSTPPIQTSMSCGNGVVIRADGSIMIDEWRFYDATSTPNNKFYPSSVTLGKTIKDTANICVEFQNGTLCGDIGKLRALIESNWPSATTRTPVKK